MKVNIGKYKNWIGPYQIAEKILFWMDKNEDDRVHKLGMFLAHGFYKRDKKKRAYLLNDDCPETWLYKLCSWIHSKQKRKMDIHIDPWDTWSMDYTLSNIILPMLKQLKQNKHGAPFVDDEDVPEHLRSTAAPPKENDYDTDENHFKRWDWVLDEMIWVHEQIVSEDDPDFWIEAPQGAYFEETDENGLISQLKYEREGRFDQEKYDAYNERTKHALILFGKYYRGLWD